jgi:outer membrane lipoprotein-sorting protein
MKKIYLALILAITCAGAQPQGQSLLQKMEALQKFSTDMQSTVTLTQQKPNQGHKTMRMSFYRRDADNSFLIHIQAPESDRGNGYLRSGEHLWMYRRNTRAFQHINRGESIGGTNARAHDFEARNLTETYAVQTNPDGSEAITTEMLGKVPTFKMQITAKVRDIDYPQKTWWIDQKSHLLLKEEAYAANGTLMHTVYFTQYTQIGAHFMAIKQLYIDEFEKGNKTIMEVTDISTKTIPNHIFTKAHLESLSK